MGYQFIELKFLVLRCLLSSSLVRSCRCICAISPSCGRWLIWAAPWACRYCETELECSWSSCLQVSSSDGDGLLCNTRLGCEAHWSVLLVFTDNTTVENLRAICLDQAKLGENSLSPTLDSRFFGPSASQVLYLTEVSSQTTLYSVCLHKL